MNGLINLKGWKKVLLEISSVASTRKFPPSFEIISRSFEKKNRFKSIDDGSMDLFRLKPSAKDVRIDASVPLSVKTISTIRSDIIYICQAALYGIFF